MNHKKIPKVKVPKNKKDKSLVSFVLIILINCGRAEKVVNDAANKPKIVIKSIN